MKTELNSKKIVSRPTDISQLLPKSMRGIIEDMVAVAYRLLKKDG